MEYYSATEKNEKMPFAATLMDLESIILNEVRKIKTDIIHIWYHLYVESKIWHKWTSMEQKQTHRHRDRFVVGKGEGDRGGMNWEFGISRCKLLYIEWTNNKVLLCSTGNYIQYPVINHNGKEYEKIYICITESLCCTAETTQHCKSTILQ